MESILHLQHNYKRSAIYKYRYAAISGLFVLRAVYLKTKEVFAQREIDFRKKQLAKEVYVISGDELVNPPWNSKNIRDWLYRRVQVTGRPLIYKACHVPTVDNALIGFEEVVPLVTRQNGKKQEGVMLSRGFVPAMYKNPEDRIRIEDVSEQTFTGFVSQLDELSGRSFFQGNTTQHGRITFTHGNLKEFAEVSQFDNQKNMGAAIIEELDDSGPIDERVPKRRTFDIEYAVPYPYKKTYSGALQMTKMPWDYKNEANIWLGLSALSLIRFLI